jgi:site-specific DNA-methyltransferase (adenine-specific)/modification methylase
MPPHGSLNRRSEPQISQISQIQKRTTETPRTLSQAVNTDALPTPDWQTEDGSVVLYNADCLDILPQLPEWGIPLIHTDPPFGVGNFVQTTGRIMGRGSNHGEKVTWNDGTPPAEAFSEMRRVSKHRIIWGANFFNCFEDRGGAIVWLKDQKMPNFSKADIASCTHYQKTEIVRVPWTNFVVTHKAESDHPCERPVELYKWCIEYLPESGHLVADPFMGSGTTGVACVKLGRSFIGIEKEPKYFDIAVKRIQQAREDIGLFLQSEPETSPQSA